MGLNLAVDDIAALELRTEGWIAGLQLAAQISNMAVNGSLITFERHSMGRSQ